MFENFAKQIKENKNEDKIHTNVLSQTAIFNPQLFDDKIKQIDDITDRELFELLKDNYKLYLDNISLRQDYFELVFHQRFLTIFTQAINAIYPIDYNYKIKCNKLAYDYLTSNIAEDSLIKSLMYNLSKTVNREVIPSLLGLGIPDDLSANLALARFSSVKEMVNIKRVNFILMTSPKELMTEQMIVFIYEKLFNSMTHLFEGVLFDTISIEGNEDAEEIYSIISLAILDLLENMPLEGIRKVLINYQGDYTSLYAPDKPRFSLRSLSMDYPRINSVVESMITTENIYLP